MKKLMALLLILVLGSSLIACNKDAGNDPVNVDKTVEKTEKDGAEKAKEPDKVEEKVKLRIYTMYGEGQNVVSHDQAVEKLKEAMPNVELELEVQAQDDGQKLRTYAATGNMPDIFHVTYGDIVTLKESENILVLDDYMKEMKFEDEMYESTKETLYAPDGHSYAFPYGGIYTGTLYYNKELFAQHNVKVPTTYAEWEEAIDIFNANDVIPLSVFAKEKWPCVLLFDMFATRQNPLGILSLDQGKSTAEDYREAATHLSKLINKGLLPKGATNMNYDQAAALFHEGKAAMFINGSWEIPGATEKLGDKVDWTYYPGLDAANYEATKYSLAGGGSNPSGFAVSPHSQYKDIAVEVASFLAKSYCDTIYTEFSNPVVACRVDDLTPKKPIPPMFQKLLEDQDNIKSSTAFSTGLSNPEVKVMLEDYCQSLLVPGYDVEEFISGIDGELKRIFNK